MSNSIIVKIWPVSRSSNEELVPKSFERKIFKKIMRGLFFFTSQAKEIKIKIIKKIFLF